jgi:hypothetical protein
MKKLVLSAFAFSALVLPAMPSAALAQASPSGAGAASCPPGSWFCAEAPQQQAAPAGQPVQPLQPLPQPEQAPGARPAPEPAPPPVVVYQSPPQVMLVRPESPPPYEYSRPPREPVSRAHEWGLNLHLEGAAMGRGSAGNAGMGGGGAGLRFKPSRYFGIEADFDVVGGHDFQGDRRSETAFTLDGLIFLNPRSRVQLYLLGGFGWSGASVRCDESMAACPVGPDQHYAYFGGQFGGGVEVRVSRVFAIDLDVRGFLRGRTDDLAQTQPEFTDQYGRTTNTSGGALFTGGMTLYF